MDTALLCSSLPPFNDCQVIQDKPLFVLCGRNHPDLGKDVHEIILNPYDVTFQEKLTYEKHWDMKKFEESLNCIFKKISARLHNEWKAHKAKPLSIRWDILESSPDCGGLRERTLIFKFCIHKHFDVAKTNSTEIVLSVGECNFSYVLNGLNYQQAMNECPSLIPFFNTLEVVIYPHEVPVENMLLIDRFTKGKDNAWGEEFNECLGAAQHYCYEFMSEIKLIFWVTSDPPDLEFNYGQIKRKTILNETVDIEYFYTRGANGQPITISYIYIPLRA